MRDQIGLGMTIGDAGAAGIREEPQHPETLASLPESYRLGWESPEEIRAAFRRSRERQRQLEWVRRAMAERLPRGDAEAIRLLYFEGLSCREAGERLGLSPSTVSRRARRGIDALRKWAPRG